jgi:DHA1 family bicyclomycin/chloramphenicol resistance-like MFS transporter
MLAPVFGGWMMTWFSWRWIFVTQGVIGAISWIGVLCMPETMKTPSATGALQTAVIYFRLLRNRRYVGFALMVSLVVFPHFAFIGGSADIYITRLGLSEQVFGYFFALNAMAIMAGSFAFTRLLHRYTSRRIMTAAFAGILIGGLGMLVSWLPGPWGLALPMAVVSFSFGLSRPPSNHLVLEQVDQHAGAASSLLIFIYFVLGAFSMWLIALDWTNKIQVIGLLAAVCGGVILSTWLVLSRAIAKRPEVPCPDGRA